MKKTSRFLTTAAKRIELADLIAKAKVWFDSLSPEQQEAHLREQQKSWAKQDKD